MKRQPIERRIRNVLLLIASVAIIIMSVVIIIFMFILRNRTSQAVIKQMEENVEHLVANKVDIAENELGKFINYLDANVNYINEIYKHPENYVKRTVGQIDTSIKDEYSLQRTILNKNIDLNEISSEMGSLANIVAYWDVLLREEGQTIASIYFGTESGFMLSYDKFASFTEIEEDGELYFNYKERPWYIDAKANQKTVIGDLDQDYFGRGLTFTCSTPFYNNGELAGVVGMDILVSDLQKAVIDVDFDSSSDRDYAFIVSSNGDIVASPFIDKNAKVFENINSPSSIFYPIKDSILKDELGVSSIDDAFCAYAPIKTVNWILCVYIPSNLVLKGVRNIENTLKRMIIIFVSLLLLALIIVYILSKRVSKRITAPVLALKGDVDIISEGNLDYKARVIGNDEISDLANSFNNMTDSLKNYINDLTSLTAEKERIGAELNVATHIQSSMLPSIFPAFPEDERFDVYATMNPAKEVGGDFYDFFKIDEKHLAMVVADVSGKGVPAALFMVIGKTLIKDHTNLKTYLNDTFYEVNNLLCESNSEDLFITAFEAVINVETGHMKYVNAGHEMPFICKKGKWIPEKIKAGFVLAGMENMKFSGGELYLDKGDKFFQYTDGVTEATNINNELYGMERLEKALNANCDKTMRELLPAIKEDIDKFVGEAPQFDDITMLGFELK